MFVSHALHMACRLLFLALACSASRLKIQSENIGTGKAKEAEQRVSADWSCDTDILFEADGIVKRIFASQYTIEPFEIFRRSYDHILSTCEDVYYITCSDNTVFLRKQKECQDDEERIRIAFSEDRSFYYFSEHFGRRVGIHAEKHQGAISFTRSFNLRSIKQGKVELWPAKDTCSSTGQGVSPGCCEFGLEYEAASAQCVSKVWWPELVCSSSDSACDIFVREFSDLMSEWFLIITSSGGGGHIEAANNLKALEVQGYQNGIIAMEKRIKDMSSLLTQEGRKGLEATSAHARARSPVEIVNIMESPCSSAFKILPLGHFMTHQWNDAQSKGDIDDMKKLIAKQSYIEPVFGGSCQTYIRDILHGSLVKQSGTPKKVIASQPLLISSIAKAVDAISRSEGVYLTLHVYMTDLPTPDSIHFFLPIKACVERSLCSSLRLHTVEALPGVNIKELSGLDDHQIITEKFMPVGGSFVALPGSPALPLPRSSTTISLKAQLPEEESFLTDTFPDGLKINENDLVLLVMLGSQPTVPAMRDYLRDAARLPALSGSSTVWVFLACGKPSMDAYRKLYEGMVTDARKYNAKSLIASTLSRGAVGKVRLVPFTGQPAQQMLGRADITVTRSGGMTCGELLALAQTDKSRRQLLHVELASGLSTTPPESKDELAVWTAKTLSAGMVPWEAGNARYLMGYLGASLVTQHSLSKIVGQYKQ